MITSYDSAIRPTSYCIIAHPQQLLAVFKARFNGPPHATDLHQFFQRDVNGSVAQVGLQLSGLALPTQHQPDIGTGQGVPHSDHPQGGKLATLGPWLPSLLVWRVHAAVGSAVATSNTVRALGAPSTRRSRGGRRPRPRCGGMWVAGRASTPRAVGHFNNIPQALPRDAIQKAWVAPECLSLPPTDTAAPGSGPPSRSSPGPTQAALNVVWREDHTAGAVPHTPRR